MSSQKAATTARDASVRKAKKVLLGQSPSQQRRFRVLEQTPVTEVMTTTIPLATPDASVGDLEWLFCHQDIDAVLVVQDERRLIGVVTKSDLLRGHQQQEDQRTVASQDWAWRTDQDKDEDEEERADDDYDPGFVRSSDSAHGERMSSGFHLVGDEPAPLRAVDLMSSVLVVVEPRLSLAEAMALMASEGVSCLPVVDRREVDELMGMISARDVIHWLARQTGQLDRIKRADVLLFDDWSEDTDYPPSLLAVERCMSCKPRCPGC